MIVYCATSNKGKLREFQLAAPDFDLRPLPNSVPPPDETGDTFEANAIEKAVAYGQHTSGYLFADDSGLEVDALGGAPACIQPDMPVKMRPTPPTTPCCLKICAASKTPALALSAS